MTSLRFYFYCLAVIAVLLSLIAIDRGGLYWAVAFFSFSTAYFSWMAARLDEMRSEAV